MLKLGLTGGIASGKSAVATILRELGFPVLDADSISHKLMEPGQAAHDEPTADLLTQRMQTHEKNAWMLRSMLA